MYKRIRIMKRLAFIMMALLLALMPAAAQNYRDSRYYNSRTDRLDYRYNYNSRITDSASVLPSPLSIPTIPVWMVATGRPA